jgi:aldehyde dehydrogenase (NAD+)
MRNYTKIYIDGAWVVSTSGEVIDVINPATEQLAGQIASDSVADIDRAVAAARIAFRTFSKTTRQERIDLLNSVLSAYAGRHQDLADALVAHRVPDGSNLLGLG